MKTMGIRLRLSVVGVSLLLVLSSFSIGCLAVAAPEPVVELMLGPGSIFNHAAFSPDGGHLAVGCLNGMVKLWSTETWELVWEVEVFSPSEVSGVAFSPDGSTIAASSPMKRDVAVLRATTGSESRRITLTAEIPGHPEEEFIGVVFPLFSPDGETLACSEGKFGSVKLVDVSTGRELGVPILHDVSGSGYVPIAFSPDGSQLASADWDGALVVVDLSTAEELVREARAKACDIAFAPDGTLRVASRRNVLERPFVAS